jgi:hypothetical protein
MLLGIIEGHFELPLSNTPALKATAIAGACAGIIAALVFRFLWLQDKGLGDQERS